MSIKTIYALPLIISAILVSCAGAQPLDVPASGKPSVQTGLELFLKKDAAKWKGKRIALITNQTGTDASMKRNIALLEEKGIQIQLLFAPEHGIYGFEEDTNAALSHFDKTLGRTVYRIQGFSAAALRSQLRKEKIDAVIYDIQDLGMRCYTFISDLAVTLDAVNCTPVRLIVFDRPNPLSPLGIDGLPADPAVHSRTVSYFPSPVLYDLTPGEAARYYAYYNARHARLTVIPMRGWDRGDYYSQTGMSWIPPSPNISSCRTAFFYAAAVYLEGTNVSVGRGTANPFEFIGAPWIDPDSFCEGLRALNIRGFTFRPARFQPLSGNWAGYRCGGVQVIYTGGTFSPAETAFRIIAYLKHNYRKFEFVSWGRGIYSIDYLAGSALFREAAVRGDDYSAVAKEIKSARQAFERRTEPFRLY